MELAQYLEPINTNGTRISLVLTMFISYYWQRVSITLQCVQAIAIFQRVVMLEREAFLISSTCHNQCTFVAS